MYIMYMLEQISISQFRGRLADFIGKLRSKSGYRLQLLDRNRPVVTLARVEKSPRKKANIGKALLAVAQKLEKNPVKNTPSDISSRVNHYLYGRS